MQFHNRSSGFFGDVASSHLFRAGGLQVVSTQYWVGQTGTVQLR